MFQFIQVHWELHWHNPWSTKFSSSDFTKKVDGIFGDVDAFPVLLLRLTNGFSFRGKTRINRFDRIFVMELKSIFQTSTSFWRRILFSNPNENSKYGKIRVSYTKKKSKISKNFTGFQIWLTYFSSSASVQFSFRWNLKNFFLFFLSWEFHHHFVVNKVRSAMLS